MSIMFADPCIPEALNAFEDMNGKHARHLARSMLNFWIITDIGVWLAKDGLIYEGELCQIAPFIDLEFKYQMS